jgi:TetR/AcrR family transcriptional regulator
VKKPPADLAERLMAVSEEVLSSDVEVRLEEVATSVGVARTTLYYYFSGRDDLVSFMLTQHVKAGADAIKQALAEPGSPSTQLRAVVVAIISFLAGHLGLCSGLLASMGASAQMEEVLQANELHIATPVRELVAAGVAAGELRKGDVADITNGILGGALLAVLSRTFQGRDVTSPGFADELAETILRGPLV